MAVNPTKYWFTGIPCRIDNNARNASVLGTSTLSFYLDISTVPGVIYYYWVQASNSAGESSLSYPGSGYCGSIDPILTIPTGVNASDGTYTDRIIVSWQAVSNASSYEVWRYAESNRAAAGMIGETTTNGYNDGTSSQGVYYYYWVRAKNANGYGSYSASDSGWKRLSPPSKVSASEGAYRYRIQVTWMPVTNAVSYEVWREEVPGENSEGGNLCKVAQTGDTYFNDYQTRAGVYYLYKVKAGNGLCSSLDYGHDTGVRHVNLASRILPPGNDYDGDKLSDPVLFNSSSGTFNVLCSALGRQTLVFGSQQGQGASGDLDGDQKADPFIYSSASGTWLAMFSGIGYYPVVQAGFGGKGNIVATADYDGDGLVDPATYNETSGV
jgi:hypothetical protein